MYVWVDALQNYLTAAGWDADMEKFQRVWPADYHFVGKDILRFHAVTWPAILLAAGLPLPRTVQAHGWLLVGGEKMSKTKLTGIAPHDLVEPFGSDAVRYFFQREVAFGQDGNFSWEALVERYNADLANGLGNLASRVTAMVERYRDGVLPGPATATDAEVAVQDAAARAYADQRSLEEVAYERALAAIGASSGTPTPTSRIARPWDLAKAATTWPWTPPCTPGRGPADAALLTAPWLTRAAPALWAATRRRGSWRGHGCQPDLAWGGLPRGARVERVCGALFPAPGRQRAIVARGLVDLGHRGTQPVEVVDYDRTAPRYATDADRLRGAIATRSWPSSTSAARRARPAWPSR